MLTTFFGLGLGLSLALEPAAAAEPAPESPAPASAPTAASEAAPAVASAAASEAAPAAAPAAAPETAPAAAPAMEAAQAGDVVTPVAEAPLEPTPPVVEGPPFYTDADMVALRDRYDLTPLPTEAPRKARWRCLIADPTCTFNVEVNATSAYAFRVQQGSPASDAISRWHSGRSQYDVWVNLPAVVETHGKYRYTRLSLGPKGGVIVSDSKTLWGNAGLAMRYWFGRGRWAPTLELSSALTFRLTTEDMDGAIGTRRSPIGVTADIGFGLGGFGALIIGGQYDSPLAREDVSEVARVYPSGMFFVGFRGNIVWGAPAAAAVGTTALSQRAEPGVRP